MDILAIVVGVAIGIVIGAAMSYRSVHMTPDDKLIEIMIERRKRQMLENLAERDVIREVQEKVDGSLAPAAAETRQNDK